MSGTANSAWVVGRLGAGVRLICLPHAGGSAGVYAPWREHVPAGVELVPVELPGRGTRWAEPLIDRRDELIDALAGGLAAELEPPYALFGHSFGGMLAYELAMEVERRGLAAPVAVLVSSTRPPHVPARAAMHAYTDDELLEWLRRVNGLPETLLRHESYLRRVLAAIRADARVAAAPQHTGWLDRPLHVFGAHADPVVTPAELEEWDRYADLTLTVYPGDHFYLYTNPSRLLADIAAALAETNERALT